MFPPLNEFLIYINLIAQTLLTGKKCRLPHSPVGTKVGYNTHKRGNLIVKIQLTIHKNNIKSSIYTIIFILSRYEYITSTMTKKSRQISPENMVILYFFYILAPFSQDVNSPTRRNRRIFREVLQIPAYIQIMESVFSFAIQKWAIIYTAFLTVLELRRS